MNNQKIGTAKIILERMGSYISIVNFTMILYLYTVSSPLGLSTEIWILLILSTIPLIILIDWYVVFPSALAVTFGKKNTEFIELKNDVREIKEWVRKKY